MPRQTLIALLTVAAATSAAAQAGNCEPLKEQIAAKFRSGGVAQVQLVVVDAAATTSGRVVGSCERGTRKIVEVGRSGTAAPAKPAPGKDQPILTECKDGTVSMGGSCRK